MPNMRILIATGLYPPDIGGPATYSKLLFDELPKRGIDVRIVSFGTVRMFPKGIRHLVYLLKLLFHGKNADVLYALDPVSVGFPSSLVAHILRKRFLLRIAGDYAWEQGTGRFGISESLDTFSKKNKGYDWRVQLLKRMQTFTVHKAEKIIVPSKYLAKITANWDIPKEKIVVIYNSFEPPEELAHKEILRGLMKLQGKVLLSAGRLVSWKGFTTLVEIMPVLIKDFPDIKLFIVGDGPDEKKLQKLILERNVGDYVTLIGRLDTETLLRYLQASDLFVLNTFYEGFSHQILESMALGIPVVTTSAGGNPEIIEHNKTGLMVSYNNKQELIRAIKETLTNTAAAQKRVRGAKQKAQLFTNEKALGGFLNVLQP